MLEPRLKRGHRFVDITGQKFGRISVIEILKDASCSSIKWHCICECGSTVTASGKALRSGNTKSCGCLKSDSLRKRMLRHGHAPSTGESKIYLVWQAMVRRCTRQSSRDYKDYGGRGITVCDRWLVFENFLGDMGIPADGMTLERKDNNLGYSPNNCKWASRLEQSNNTRFNVILFDGNEKLTMAQFSRKHAVHYDYLRNAIRQGKDSVKGIHFKRIEKEKSNDGNRFF